MSTTKPSAVLKKAMKLIEDPKKWGQGHWRPDGVHCALSALGTASFNSGVKSSEQMDLLRFAFTDTEGQPIYSVNDAPDTTHADVLTAYCFAIELAKDAEKGGQ